MKKLFLLIILTTFINASINLKDEVIQVGAFKNKNSIEKLKKKLSNYNILVKTYPNKLKKIFVINIAKKSLENKLRDIRMISPKAFILSRKKKLELIKQDKPSNWFNPTSTDANTSKLDSKAIIKTRKKFFK
jgi:hypothetical protein